MSEIVLKKYHKSGYRRTKKDISCSLPFSLSLSLSLSLTLSLLPSLSISSIIIIIYLFLPPLSRSLSTSSLSSLLTLICPLAHSLGCFLAHLPNCLLICPLVRSLFCSFAPFSCSFTHYRACSLICFLVRFLPAQLLILLLVCSCSRLLTQLTVRSLTF